MEQNESDILLQLQSKLQEVNTDLEMAVIKTHCDDNFSPDRWKAESLTDTNLPHTWRVVTAERVFFLLYDPKTHKLSQHSDLRAIRSITRREALVLTDHQCNPEGDRK